MLQEETTSTNFQEVYNSATASKDVSSSPSSPHAVYTFEISVSDPQKQGDGIQAHILYKVTSKTNAKGYHLTLLCVPRRYSDFAWLHSQLAAHCPGVILPPLPDKALVGRFGSDFIEGRRKQLEQYLLDVTQHPRLQLSPHLRTFLQVPHDIDTSTITASDQGSNTSLTTKSSNFMGKLRELQVSAQIGLSQSGWIRQDISLPHDVQCAEMKAYLNALDSQLSAVQRFSEKIVNRHRDLATGLSEFGLAVTLLGNCETDTQYLANGLSQLGNAADRLSIIHHEQADKESESFDERVKNYIKVVACAKEAIKGRERALLSYQTALTMLEAKKQKLVKAQVLVPPTPFKVADAERELSAAEEDVKTARQVHEDVSAVTREEMMRFQKEKVVYFKSMVVEFVKLQIEFARKTQHVWEGLAPEIDALSSEMP